MKLGWLLVTVGGVYLIYRTGYAVCWGLYGISTDIPYEVSYMLIQAAIIGGVPLIFGIRRIRKARKK